MKSAFILVISSFFLIGVFGESVSVMVGGSVTLHTDLTEILRTDTVEWRFNGERIAKISRDSIGTISVQLSPEGPFRGRLQLNNQTGDLKITAFSNTDSGQYILKIRSTRGSSDETFSVNGVNADKDPVTKVPGTVGESVNLKPEKKSDEVIQWRFGPQNTLIAKVGVLPTDYLDEKFKGRLKLDDDTGSLTITDIRTTDSGVYEAGIRRSGSRYTIHETFSVTVTGLSTGAIVGIVVVAVVVLLVFAAVVIYRYYRSSKTETHSEVNGQNHTSNEEEKTELKQFNEQQ